MHSAWAVSGRNRRSGAADKTTAWRWGAIALVSLVAAATFMVWEPMALAQATFVGKSFNDQDQATLATASLPTTIAGGAEGAPVGGSNRYMLLSVAFLAPATTVTSATFGGANFVQVPLCSGTNSCHMETWQLVNPSATTGNIVVNTSANGIFLVSASWYSGVDQTHPIGNCASTTGSGTAISLTSRPKNMDMLVDSGCAFKNSVNPVVTESAGTTVLANGKQGKIYGINNYIAVTSTAAVTLTPSLASAPVGWFYSIVDIKGTGETAIRLDDFAAGYDGARVHIGWRTGFEVDNLGFHLYRDDGRGRVRLTAAPIVGSALLAGSGVSLQAGRIYAWDDAIEPDRRGNMRYWLEEIDLNGQRTMFGPARVAVGPSPGPGPDFLAARTTVTLAAPVEPYDVPPAPPEGAPPVLDLGQENPQQWALAAGPAVKLGVDHEGWYEVGRSQLVAAGLDPSVDPRRLSLFVEGREVPILVRGEEDGRLDDADAVGFFGSGLNAPSTDTRVYWLRAGERPGQRIERALPAPPSGAAAPNGFVATVEGRPRSVYFAALANGDQSNFFGPIIASTPITERLRVRHRVADPARAAVLEVGAQGVSADAHEIVVELGGRSLGVLRLAGRDRASDRFSIPDDALPEDGVVEVTLRAQSGDADVSLVDFVRLEYAHTLAADTDGDTGALRFSAPGGVSLAVAGFAPGDDVDVFDVTDPATPVQLPGATADATGQVGIVTAGVGPRRLVAVSRGHGEPLRTISANRPSRWTAPQPGSDLAVIGPASLLPGIEPLARLRQAQGWTVALVDIEDVYDELSFGAKQPNAIRSFVHRATRAWASPPRAVMFLGDATFDPRDFIGNGAFDLVPTKLVDTKLLETASDDWLTDFDGDGIADVPVGRIPARNPADVAAIVAKLLAAPQFATVEAASAAGGPLVFVAGQNDDSSDFRAASVGLRAKAPTSYRALVVDPGLVSGDPFEQVRQALLMEPLYVSYFGHGSPSQWAGGLLSNDSVPLLEDRGPGAFWSQSTCLTGFFQDIYQPSLAETLLARPNGGAFGVWASSGLTELSQQTEMQRAFTENLLASGMAVGEAAGRAKSMTTSLDVRRTWILFGDPSWRLVAARVEPPAPDAGVPARGDSGAPEASVASDVSGAPEAGAASDVAATRLRPPGPGGCACTVMNGASASMPSGSCVLCLALVLAFRIRRKRARESGPPRRRLRR